MAVIRQIVATYVEVCTGVYNKLYSFSEQAEKMNGERKQFKQVTIC